jgi:hypothetical protein
MKTMSAPIPPSEKKRLKVLWQYEVLDTVPEEVFDDLTELAAWICEAPIALISLVDEKRQWFKSKVGTSVKETSRDISFCTHAIDRTDLFIVPDATLDTRFANSPLVTSEPKIRFYAGAPLITPDGYARGPCVSLTKCLATCVRNSSRPCGSWRGMSSRSSNCAAAPESWATSAPKIRASSTTWRSWAPRWLPPAVNRHEAPPARLPLPDPKPRRSASGPDEPIPEGWHCSHCRLPKITDALVRSPGVYSSRIEGRPGF